MADLKEAQEKLEFLTEMYDRETALQQLKQSDIPIVKSFAEEQIRYDAHNQRLAEMREREKKRPPMEFEGLGIKGGIDFDKIKWGSLTEQMKHHPEMKSLEQFSNHILANPKDFQKRTIKRANFYKNVIEGKSITQFSDSDSDDEEIISHNTIMPMTRPVCRHPALESSTMTMNPGAYNNIKPLMGHLMGEGVSPHIRRSATSSGTTMSHYGDHALHPQMMPQGKYFKHPAMKNGAITPTMSDLVSHGVKHLKDTYGSHPEHAHHLLDTALKQGPVAIPKELHPLAHQGLSMGLKHLLHTMGGTIGGSFWDDLGSNLGHAFTGVGDIVKDTAYKIGDQIKAEAPGLLHQVNEIYNDPKTQMGISGVTTGLSEAGLPEVGIPLSIANAGIKNALDAGDNHRDVKPQLEHAYLNPAKKFLRKIGIKGVGIGEDLAKTLAHNTGRLADSGSDYLIRQMDGHGLYAQGGKIGENLAKNLANNVGRLADSGSNYLIRQMGEDPNAGGKIGHNLAKNLAKNVGRLADSGSDYLIRKMDGGEVGDGLYAQGRGVRHTKGSPEMKAHMARLRAMRKKKVKGGALPPPSRSPVTAETIGQGLYA